MPKSQTEFEDELDGLLGQHAKPAVELDEANRRAFGARRDSLEANNRYIVDILKTIGEKYAATLVQRGINCRCEFGRGVLSPETCQPAYIQVSITRPWAPTGQIETFVLRYENDGHAWSRRFRTWDRYIKTLRSGEEPIEPIKWSSALFEEQIQEFIRNNM
jgi:hypothetical protein